MQTPLYTVLGFMSGTSLDGVDAALVRTDGGTHIETGPALTLPYTPAFRAKLRGILGGQAPKDQIAAIEQELTDLHAEAGRALILEAQGWGGGPVLVGFHGQTIFHAPQQRKTWQIGDGARLARALNLPVVADFRSADVAAGGEGAPLAPLFHQALAHDLPKPLAVLNIGGVSNYTWLGAAGEVLAGDPGPGNALIDDWIFKHTGKPYDEGGRLGLTGHVYEAYVARWLQHPYFLRTRPKSIDRDGFKAALQMALSLEDGLATLAAFTVRAIALSLKSLPAPTQYVLVTGGGRHNAFLMQFLRLEMGIPVEPVETAGWQGDALEAQAFGYLAVRSRLGLPLSLPSTTGVPKPQTGGVLFSL